MKNQSGSRSDKVFDAVLLVVLTLILLITLYPVYFVLISSFSDPVAVAGGDVPSGRSVLPWKAIRPYSRIRPSSAGFSTLSFILW